MSDSTSFPVILGLVVGIAFVAAFSFFVQGSPLADGKIMSFVAIPPGASMANSGITFEPQEIRVVIGYNNTVRWLNQDSVAHFIEASNKDDPAFWNATVNTTNDNPAKLIPPDGAFQFTFERPGEFAYHGKPWMQGKVVVLPPY